MKTIFRSLSYKDANWTWIEDQAKVKHGKLIFLYDDGTWEEIFEYSWNYIGDREQTVNTTWVSGATRAEGIERIKDYVNKGRIKGKLLV